MAMHGTPVEGTIRNRSVAVAVVTAVAEATDSDPTDLEPLYRTIDPDALDQLFRTTPAGQRPGSVQVSFTMEGCEVVVDGDGRVEVTPPENGRTVGPAGRPE